MPAIKVDRAPQPSERGAAGLSPEGGQAFGSQTLASPPPSQGPPPDPMSASPSVALDAAAGADVLCGDDGDGRAGQGIRGDGSGVAGEGLDMEKLKKKVEERRGFAWGEERRQIARAMGLPPKTCAQHLHGQFVAASNSPGIGVQDAERAQKRCNAASRVDKSHVSSAGAQTLQDFAPCPAGANEGDIRGLKRRRSAFAPVVHKKSTGGGGGGEEVQPRDETSRS